MAASKDVEVEMTAPPEAVAVGPDYSSIASSMALVREGGKTIQCSQPKKRITTPSMLYKGWCIRVSYYAYAKFQGHFTKGL